MPSISGISRSHTTTSIGCCSSRNASSAERPLVAQNSGPMPARAEQARQELALQIVVVDDEHAQRAVLQAAVNPSVHETALCTPSRRPARRLDL